jgi:hypothetical protein
VSDCLNVVKAINEDGTREEHCMIIREILEKRREFSVATFSHERREAKWGSTSTGAIIDYFR